MITTRIRFDATEWLVGFSWKVYEGYDAEELVWEATGKQPARLIRHAFIIIRLLPMLRIVIHHQKELAVKAAT